MNSREPLPHGGAFLHEKGDRPFVRCPSFGVGGDFFGRNPIRIEAQSFLIDPRLHDQGPLLPGSGEIDRGVFAALIDDNKGGVGGLVLVSPEQDRLSVADGKYRAGNRRGNEKSQEKKKEKNTDDSFHNGSLFQWNER